MSTDDFELRLQRIEDRLALKSLVDRFSNLADQKDVAAQLPLFTEDATVETYFEGQLFGAFHGREQIGDGFSAYLANFKRVYHINGQQTIELNGDHATGTSYCLVVLVRTENGKKLRSTGGVYYHDEYFRDGSDWLIAKRVSHFAWRDLNEMTPPTV